MALTVPFLSEGKFIMLGSTWIRKMGFIDVFSDYALAQYCLGLTEDAFLPSASPGLPAPHIWVCGRRRLAWLWCSNEMGSSLHLHHDHKALLFLRVWMSPYSHFQGEHRHGECDLRKRYSPKVLRPKNGHNFVWTGGKSEGLCVHPQQLIRAGQCPHLHSTSPTPLKTEIYRSTALGLQKEMMVNQNFYLRVSRNTQHSLLFK